MEARESLIRFTEHTHPQYQVAQHHRLIAEKLEAVERGEIRRLMIFMPPRHGKSELASRRFPAWYLGRNPAKQLIAASYNSDLASDFGREVRNIVATPEYQGVFDAALSPDSKAADRWHTSKGGMYVAAGVGTAVTGRGADVLLIDDPFKDRQEADSEVRREAVANWYRSTAYTRLMPGGAIVLIQTRWHDDDLAGRLLEAMDKGGQRWEVLCLKALSDDGRALWPEWYPADVLEETRAVLGPRDWSALYQQEPIPDTGDYFKRDWVRWYEHKPAHLQVYGASDYAVTSNGGDWTVHVVVGVDPNDDLYVLDLWRGQTASDEWLDRWCDLVLAWKPQEWAEEGGQIRASLDSFIKKRAVERKAYVLRQAYSSVADKASRAQAFRGRMAMGKVYFPTGAPWVETLVYEMLRFPSGTHDDQVDALSLIGRMLARMESASVPREPQPAKLLQNVTFNELLAAHEKGGRRARI